MPPEDGVEEKGDKVAQKLFEEQACKLRMEALEGDYCRKTYGGLKFTMHKPFPKQFIRATLFAVAQQRFN